MTPLKALLHPTYCSCNPYLSCSFSIWNTQGVQLFLVFPYMLTSNSPFVNKLSLNIPNLSMPLFSIGTLTVMVQMTSKFIPLFGVFLLNSRLLYLADYSAPPLEPSTRSFKLILSSIELLTFSLQPLLPPLFTILANGSGILPVALTYLSA